MTDDIVTRLANLADKFKDGELEMLYSDYETVCDAWREIELLQKLGNQLAYWARREDGAQQLISAAHEWNEARND